MNILVFGASGPLGRQIVRRALSARHQVTAFVRTPRRLDPDPGLRELTGDVLDAGSVAAAIPGHDAVISALGRSRPVRDLHPCVTGIIEAMKAADVRRLIWISSHGVGDSRGRSGFMFEHIVAPLLWRAEFADKECQEAIVTASGLDWTIVRPARLTRGLPTGRLLAAPRLSVTVSNTISRADVAAFVLDELRTGQHVLTAPTVAAALPAWSAWPPARLAATPASSRLPGQQLATRATPTSSWPRRPAVSRGLDRRRSWNGRASPSPRGVWG